MNTINEILNAEHTALDTSAKMNNNDITYEQVCQNLKFYCGFNPKTDDRIQALIKGGLPMLKNVEVKARGLHVKIKFTMPDGTAKKYEYR